MTNLQTPNCQTGVAGSDLRQHMNKIVAYDANRRLVACISPNSATALGGPVGVLYHNNGGSLTSVAYAILGNADVIVANTVAPGDFITCNSVSLATPCTSGSVAIGVSYQFCNPGGLARVELCTPFRMTGVV
jgi:hypothetical protein